MTIKFAVVIFSTLASQISENTASNEDQDNFTLPVKPGFCRTERRLWLAFHRYRRDTCARCYKYMPDFAFPEKELKFRYNVYSGTLMDPRTNISYVVESDNWTHPVVESFFSDVFASKWMACCDAAIECCKRMTKDPVMFDDKTYCPRTWDGWQCWPDTPAGETAEIECQEHIYFSSERPLCPRHAAKACTPNGTWYTNPVHGSEWTNYSGCGRIMGVTRRQYFHIATHAVSIVFLIPAIIIFSVYKQLQVYRITMHKHLFASLLFNGIFVIILKSIVMLDELDAEKRRTVSDENGPGCKTLFIITKYFRMTNYMWMFCEGFYLHQLISAAFAEQKKPLLFYTIGWGFPLIPAAIYAGMREAFANERCWLMPVHPYEWILNAPNLISLVLNLAFLCHIIQILVTKLRSTHANEPSQYRKAVRATLVLVPLFGLHFFLVIYRPQSGACAAIEAYTLFNHALDGLQGFAVSLIFCYLNGEVLFLIKRSYRRYKLRNETPKKPSGHMILSRMSMSTHMSSVFENNTANNRRNSHPVPNTNNTPC